MTVNSTAETSENISTTKRPYYIPLKGPTAGIPTEAMIGACVEADGGVISRSHYPKACSVLETALGQQQFIMKKRGKLRKSLVDAWNGFITRNMENHFWLWSLYRDCYKQNPNWHPECLQLPDWREDNILCLMLKLAKKTVTDVKLEPKGMDFE